MAISLYLILPSVEQTASIVMRFLEAGYNIQQSPPNPLFMRSPSTSILTFCFRIDKGMSQNEVKAFGETVAKLLKDILYLSLIYQAHGHEPGLVFLPANVPEGKQAMVQGLTGTAYDAIGED